MLKICEMMMQYKQVDDLQPLASPKFDEMNKDY